MVTLLENGKSQSGNGCEEDKLGIIFTVDFDLHIFVEQVQVAHRKWMSLGNELNLKSVGSELLIFNKMEYVSS